MPKPVAISKHRKLDHVLECQRGDPREEQIIWKLRPMPYAVRGEAQNALYYEASLSGAERAKVDTTGKCRIACKFGLEGWGGAELLDDRDEVVQPEYEPKPRYGVRVLADACLARLPEDVLMELGIEILALSNMGGEALGKSASQPTSPPATQSPSAQHALDAMVAGVAMQEDPNPMEPAHA